MEKWKETFYFCFKIATISGLVVLLSCVSLPKKQLTPEAAAWEKVIQQVSPEKLMAYVRTLSSEKYAGRLTGTPEYRVAAQWLAAKFKELGLQPVLRNGNYLSTFPNPYTVIFVGGELAYVYGSSSRRHKRKFVYEKDYYPGSQSADGTTEAEVVYVGYGITAPELNYDDYQGINVRGKIVFVEPGTPVSYEEDLPSWSDWQPYASLRYKIKMAVAHGAKGMLFNKLEIIPAVDYIPGFRVAQVGEEVTKVLFAQTGKNHAAVIQAIKQSRTPQSFRTRKRFRIQNFSEHYPRGKGYNVLGLLPGSDPLLGEEYIVVGAHLDGVGFCYEVVPGANDNASGVAVLLALAETLVKSQSELKRSIVFIGWGGTEQGNRGVQAFFEQSLFPRDKIVLYLNLDEVGAGQILEVDGGMDYPQLWKMFKRYDSLWPNKEVKLGTLVDRGWPQRDALFFKQKRIPTLDFRVIGSPSFIHTPKDKPETLSPETMVDLARWIASTLRDTANKETLIE